MAESDECWLCKYATDEVAQRVSALIVDNVHAEMVALIPAIQAQKPGASTREVMEDRKSVV